jgi:hypothetical protein
MLHASDKKKDKEEKRYRRPKSSLVTHREFETPQNETGGENFTCQNDNPFLDRGGGTDAKTWVKSHHVL